MNGMVRVGVLDARDLVRAGVAALVDGVDGIHVVAAWSTTPVFRGWSGAVQVVLLDPMLGGGQDLAENVARARSLGANVLAVTDSPSATVLHRIAEAGADGVLLQTADRRAFVDAVLAVAGHRMRVFDVWGDAPEQWHANDARLTAVEQQVLALYASGVKAESVARSVGLSASTVTTYVSRIRRKYERVGRLASSRVDLYRRAVEDGVLPMAQTLTTAG